MCVCIYMYLCVFCIYISMLVCFISKIYKYIYQISNILINIIISSLKLLRLFRNKITVIAQLVTTWCTYRMSKIPYLSIIVFCNILGKWKLTDLIKQTLHVHFVESINWLGLYLYYNWIMQLLQTVSYFSLSANNTP